MASRRRDRQQALDEAYLRYGGESDQLTALLRSVVAQRKQDVGQARRGAKMLERSARREIPVLRENYDSAASTAVRQDERMRGELGKLGSAAEGFRAALSYESGGDSRLQAERASALNELIGRATGARAQGLQEVRAIRAGSQAERAKILDQLLSNQKQAGVYAASRFGELRGEQAKTRNENRQKRADRRQRERNSLRSAGIDPKTNKPIPGSKLDPDANNKPGDQSKTPDKGAVKDSRKAIQKVQNAQTVYKQYSGTAVKDNATGKTRKPTEGEIRTRMIDEGFNNREIDIALDLARHNGRLSRRGVRAAKELGIIIPKRWRPVKAGNKGINNRPSPYVGNVNRPT